MTKLSSRFDKTPRVRANMAVRLIRQRFSEALNLGYTNEEAARLAHGDEPILPVATELSSTETVEQQEKKAAVSTSSAQISGQASSSKTIASRPETISRDDIPPNWQDLPWTHLKELASRVSGSSEVKSRKNAVDLIESTLSKK